MSVSKWRFQRFGIVCRCWDQSRHIALSCGRRSKTRAIEVSVNDFGFVEFRIEEKGRTKDAMSEPPNQTA